MSEADIAEEEVVELELEEDRIVGYLVDEDDNEIGVLYTDDDGKEVEIYFDEIESEQFAEAVQAEGADDDSVEMEIDPDSILYYMVDPKGNELGFVALNEAGEKEEYLYPEDAVEQFYLLSELEKKLHKATGVAGSASNLVSAGTNVVGGVVNKVAGKEVVKTSGGEKPDPDDDGVDKDDLKDMFSTFKDVAIGGYAAISGVMDQVDDVRDSLDEINPKKRRQNRRARKAAEEAAAAQTVVVQQSTIPAYDMPNLNNAAPATEPTPATEPAPASASTEAQKTASESEPVVKIVSDSPSE